MTEDDGPIDRQEGTQELLQCQQRLPMSTCVGLIIGASVEAPVGYGEYWVEGITLIAGGTGRGLSRD